MRLLGGRRWFGAVFLVILSAIALSGYGATVRFIRGEEATRIDLSTFSEQSGTVAYEGPSADGDPNWKASHEYTGAPLLDIVEQAGGLAEGETLGVVAVDGWYKILPHGVVYGETAAGSAILAASRDGESSWEDGPMLILLPEDQLFSNEDMLSAFGAGLSHYFGESPSTTGLMVKNVAYLVVDYDGTAILPETFESAEPTGQAADGVVLTLTKGSWFVEYTLDDLQALETLTAAGTFTNSAGTDYTATYTGVPLMTLLGNVPDDGTLLVTASDGYSMNYAVDLLADTTEGTWVLAFKENGEWMPNDPGPLRIVRIGEETPHFTSALSARMVERIELLGTYEAYTLRVVGAVEREFIREELEAGVGCPCHTASVTATSKGETHEYSGLPLWRLVAYVDDQVFPASEQGIHYNDEDFSDALAEMAYTIRLIASDGYEQTVTSDLIARDDRFIVAFKKDNVFLDPTSDGFMRFTFDDSVELPEDLRLRPVKSLVEIRLEL